MEELTYVQEDQLNAFNTMPYTCWMCCYWSYEHNPGRKASFDRLCPDRGGQQENDGTDNDNVNKAGSEDPTQSKKDQPQLTFRSERDSGTRCCNQ